MKILKTICCVLAINLFFCISAFAAENNNNEITLNSIYKNAYEKCQDQNYPQIIDEYSAYSYLLHHKDLVSIKNGKISISTVDIDHNQLKILNDFISKINKSVELSSLKVNPDLSFNTPPAPQVSNKPRPLAETIDLMPECRAHAAELREVFDNAVFGSSHIVAGMYFAERVKGGGIWDYKRYLGLNTQYYEFELQATMTGETIGNFHYGYVGSEVFSPTTLKSAAGLVQITSGTAKLEWFSTYFDDPNDQHDIEWGINVYNLHN